MNKHIEMTPEVEHYRDCVETQEITVGRWKSVIQGVLILFILVTWCVLSLHWGDVAVFQILSEWLVFAMIATGVSIEHTESNVVV